MKFHSFIFKILLIYLPLTVFVGTLDAVIAATCFTFDGLDSSSGICINWAIFSKNSSDNIKSKLETFRFAVKKCVPGII